MKIETATLGGGCFWCLEAIYQTVPGVLTVVSGYAGGEKPHPTYDEVCTGKTGHAEVIQLTFDPQVVSYRKLLEIFFTIHDPTTLDRQGNDIGPQYRSILFYHTNEQYAMAQQVKREMENVWDGPLVTALSPFVSFYPAESQHQNYYKTHQDEPYCAFVIAGKLKKYKEMFD